MKFAFDTEAALIAPGLLAPPMACTSWANAQLGSGLFHVRDVRDRIEEWLRPGCLLIGANTAFDSTVICAQFPEYTASVFDKYERGEFRDVLIDQRLIDIARGELGGYTYVDPDEDPDDEDRGTRIDYLYNLSALHDRYGFGPLEKDEWRLKYGGLIDVPMSQWPAGAKAYSELDAVATMRVHLAQQEFAEYLGDGAAQARAAFALHLMSCRGVRTDPVACERLAVELEAEIIRCRKLCEQIKRPIEVVKKRSKGGVKYEERTTEMRAMVRDNEDGTYSKTKAVVQQYMVEASARAGVPVKITKTGQKKKSTDLEYVSTDYEACTDTGDPVLAAYTTFTSATTLRKKVERLKQGAYLPLQTRFEVLQATGRTASMKPGGALVGDNFQNFARNGLVTDQKHELPGVRGCVVPRPGYAFVSVDCPNAEMRAMGQICIWTVGYSILADALNANRDTHLALAAAHLGMPYESSEALLEAEDKAIAELRQFMKIPNFSLLGGASYKAMIPFAKRQKPAVILSEDKARDLYNTFHSTWTEIGIYHDQIKSACRRGNTEFVQFISERVRGNCKYTVACNTGFQGLTGDAAKAALLPVANECYTGRMPGSSKRSPLFGSFPVFFVHDEIVTETPIPMIHEAGHRLAELAVKPWNDIYTPDVKMTTKPAAMLRLAKGAKPVYDSSGVLQIWHPKEKVAA
jgi:hypothetical protein